MDLQQRIDADIKEAMLARDKDRLNALRAIKSAILLELTKEGGATLTTGWMAGKSAGAAVTSRVASIRGARHS